MKISFIQAILIGVVYYLGVTGTPWLSLLGSISFMQKPFSCWNRCRNYFR